MSTKSTDEVPSYTEVVIEGFSGESGTSSPAPEPSDRSITASPVTSHRLFKSAVRKVIESNVATSQEVLTSPKETTSRASTPKPKKLRRKTKQAVRLTKSEPAISKAASEQLTRETKVRKLKAKERIRFLQENIKHVDTKKVIKNLAPTKIPIVKRFVEWARLKW